MKLHVDVRVLKGIAAILGIVLALAIVMILIRNWEETQGQAEPEESSDLSPTVTRPAREITYFDGVPYARKEDLETVLFLGLDKYEGMSHADYLNDQQADFLLLLVLDRQEQICTPIQLNRDTMTEIQILGVTGDPAGTFEGQLALSHTYGSGEEDSCENSVLAVSKLLYGMDIDHYVSMTMDGVVVLNDLVGGVTVEVMDDFSGVDGTLIQGETVTLLGQQALTYVRARGGMEDSSNLRRMERQRQYLEALQNQLSEQWEEDSGFVLEALLQVNDYLVSDCTVNELSDLAESLNTYEVGEIRTTQGEAVLGEEFMEFYVDEEALQELVLEIFYEPVEEGQ